MVYNVRVFCRTVREKKESPHIYTAVATVYSNQELYPIPSYSSPAMATFYRWRFFLSHDWGNEGRDNHYWVVEISKGKKNTTECTTYETNILLFYFEMYQIM
jgi:hypothetical protein